MVINARDCRMIATAEFQKRDGISEIPWIQKLTCREEALRSGQREFCVNFRLFFGQMRFDSAVVEQFAQRFAVV